LQLIPTTGFTGSFGPGFRGESEPPFKIAPVQAD
jgi:hypothetical protein